MKKSWSLAMAFLGMTACLLMGCGEMKEDAAGGNNVKAEQDTNNFVTDEEATFDSEHDIADAGEAKDESAEGEIAQGGNPMVDMMASMGSADLGFDAAAFVESEAGQWIAGQLRFVVSGYDQMDPEIVEYWKSIGMDKRYFEADDELQEWSMFTPVDMKEGEEYPTLFAMHMGGTNIFFGETMGYVEDAAENGYIVICPSWSMENATAAQKEAYESSGMNSYEAYSFMKVLERAKDLAPIDESRIYVAGFSGGGNASALIALECPTVIAGCSPSTGAAVQTYGETELEKLAQYGMGLMMCYGTMDREERWPIVKEAVELGDVSNHRTISERIANVNAWTRACGAVTGPTTEEAVNELASGGESTASGKFGLNFDEEYVKEYETQYFFGDFLNSDGQAVVRYMAIEGNPHFVSPEWASQVYEFLSRFSRDSKTGKLIVSAEE